MTKADQVRAYFSKHPNANIKEVAAKFGIAASPCYNLRKQALGGTTKARKGNLEVSDRVVDPDTRRKEFARDMMEQLNLMQRRIMVELL